jgi:hypothetical protein
MLLTFFDETACNTYHSLSSSCQIASHESLVIALRTESITDPLAFPLRSLHLGLQLRSACVNDLQLLQVRV